MKSEIVFFDTNRNSILGTKRALISFIPLVIIFSILASTKHDNPNSWAKLLGVLLLSFMLCSAIGVQLPTSYKEAGVFGLLVGLVVGACLTGLALINDPKPALLWKTAVILLPLITSVLSLLTHYFSSRFNLYP